MPPFSSARRRPMAMAAVAALALARGAWAGAERSPPPLGSARGALALAVGCALALATAVAVHHALVSRRSAKAGAPSKTAKVASVLQRDPELESAAEASAQAFPLGARVQLADAREDGVVVSYDPATDSYEVQPEAHGEQAITVPSSEIVQPRVADFYIYPIKSCGSIRLDSAAITEKGLLHDREWMFADDKGKFITQRRYHKLALVQPKLVPSVEYPTAIVLTASGMPDLEVPIIHESKGTEMQVNVWKSSIIAIDQGDAAAEWITTFLSDQLGDRKLRLVHFKESFTRQTHERYAPGHQTGFADAFPILIAVDASLEDLNRHLEEPIPMNRFRPNIVLTGAPAYADDNWNCLTIGSLKFRNVRPCGRCNLPCVDQATGSSHPGHEPSKTLVRVRNGVDLGFDGASKADNYFGSNLVVEKVGRLNVGDSARVLTMKSKIYA